MNSKINRVEISKAISEDLASRYSASKFIEDLSKYGSMKIEVDFSNVKTITRSFAHEYMTRKKASSLNIVDENIPLPVQRMFHVVEESPERKDLIDTSSYQITNL